MTVDGNDDVVVEERWNSSGAVTIGAVCTGANLTAPVWDVSDCRGNLNRDWRADCDVIDPFIARLGTRA